MKLTNLVTVLAVLSFAACGPGEMGPPGPAGPAGPKGDPGSAGAPGSAGSGLADRTFCFGAHTVGNTTVGILHARYDFADGSTFITCHIQPQNSTAPRADSVPAFYVGSSNEAKTGACEVVYDTDNSFSSGIGKYVFEIPKGASLGKAFYVDTGSSANGATISLTCEKVP